MSRTQSAKMSDHFDDPVSMLQTKRVICRFNAANESRKNKLAVSGVDWPGWQGAKTLENLICSGFRNAGGRHVSASKRFRHF